MTSKVLAALAALTVSTVLANSASATSPIYRRPPTMTCVLAVVTAGDMVGEKDITDFSAELTTPIIDDQGAAEYTVAGQTVAVLYQKKPHANLFDTSFKLLTPEANRDAASGAVATIYDQLYYDGPTDVDSDWDVVPGPNADRYHFRKAVGGQLVYTPKLVAAIQAAGHADDAGFKNGWSPLTDGQHVVDFVKEQVRDAKLQPTDVVGFASVISCTYTKQTR